MIRQLAQCPYCNGCEIALDDHPELVFNPATETRAPCPHLAWVDGRYSQWDHPGHGADQMIGSVKFRHDAEGPSAEERTDQLLPYLQELLEAGPGWAFGPAEPHVIQRLSAEEKATDSRGKSFTVWDVDGWAVFARNPARLWAQLPSCQERQLAALEVDEGETEGGQGG